MAALFVVTVTGLATIFGSIATPGLAETRPQASAELTTTHEEARAAPEASTGRKAKAQGQATQYMVSAANPYAVAAGLEMLKTGGSAIDAAIAIQLVLNLVEPQSSGIGGGAFILHWHKASAQLATYDGRETAPAAATPDRFLGPDGKPMPFDKAVHSGLSVGVPGLVRVLALVHQTYGKLAWSRLFEPAIKLAEDGFEVSRRLNLMLNWYGAEKFGPAARDYFFNEKGWALPKGELLKNPIFAQTLKQIAVRGPNAFYAGEIANAIVLRLKNAPNAPSDITLDDLKSYQALKRPPICLPYRGYKVCGMGPPSSGGLTIAQVLKLLAPHDLGTKPLNSDALHLVAEAERLAYADRNRYMADADFVIVPSEGLLDDAYLAERGKLIDTKRSMGVVEAGMPPHNSGASFGRDATKEGSGTSHISIVDGDGNAISMTTTIESAFGSRLMAAGFLLNNELTDFSFRPSDDEGKPIANRVEGGKRPRSSMAPTIIFDPTGKLWALVGSPGGSRIILYVVKAIIGLIDWELDAQKATSLANFGSRNGPFEAEISFSAPRIVLQMALRGHKTKAALMTSGLQIIVRRDGYWEGGADPRREGEARGE